MISTTSKFFGLSLAHRLTRRWIVALYWLWVAVFSFLFFRHQSQRSPSLFDILLVVQMLALLPALMLGGVSSEGPVKPFRRIRSALFPERNDLSVFGQSRPIRNSAAADEADLDERETRLRDRVHFVAYTWTRWIALLCFAVYGCVNALDDDALRRAGPFFLYLLTLVIWSLPQSLILWNEPDMEATS
jgi:hypothetical protein